MNWWKVFVALSLISFALIWVFLYLHAEYIKNKKYDDPEWSKWGTFMVTSCGAFIVFGLIGATMNKNSDPLFEYFRRFQN